MSHHDTSAGGLVAYLILVALIFGLVAVDSVRALCTRRRP